MRYLLLAVSLVIPVWMATAPGESIFETSWVSEGPMKQKVTTDCRGKDTELCALDHRVAVSQLTSVYPPIDPGSDPPEDGPGIDWGQ